MLTFLSFNAHRLEEQGGTGPTNKVVAVRLNHLQWQTFAGNVLLPLTCKVVSAAKESLSFHLLETGATCWKLERERFRLAAAFVKIRVAQVCTLLTGAAVGAERSCTFAEFLVEVALRIILVGLLGVQRLERGNFEAFAA